MAGSHFSCVLNKVKLVKVLISASLLITIFAPLSSFAQGNLLISPKRLVFDGAKKTQEINLANTGTDTSKYLISVMEIRMREDGGFEEIATPDSGQFFASKFLRFFPRSVTLAPNESQVIKVQLIKTNEITESEYRSHVYFRANLDTKPLGEKDTVKETNDISVKLTPVFGITIPVIIRNGLSTTKMSISDCSLKMNSENIPVIAMALHRTGNMSSYGDINVEFISNDGKKTIVGMARGVAVYSPNKVRRFQFELYSNSGVNFHNGKLHVSYTAGVDQLAKPGTEPLAVYAETDIILQ
jgi:P pilus assembly chaperone PapD